MLKDVSERMFKQIDLMTPDGPMMEYETSLKRTDGESFTSYGEEKVYSTIGGS